MMVDLLSLVLTLEPAIAPPAAGAPPWWGRAAHQLLLDVLRQADPELAQAVHDREGLKPFTASTLMGRFPDRRLDPKETYTLRLTGLTRPVSQALLAAARDGPLAPGVRLELDFQPFRVQAAASDPSAHPWAAAATYADLSAAYLLAGEPAPRRLAFQFTSPVTFKSAGRHVPLPLPDLFFGSLLERWNAFAPVAFPPEARRYAEECLALGRYNLSSRAVPVKAGGLRVGGVGQAQYVSTSYDRYWMSVMAALAEFALYSGAGAGVTTGLGQCRRVDG